MTELLNGRRFEGRAAGKGAAPPRTAPQRCGGVTTSFSILRSTFYPNLKQIGQKMTELLNGRHFKGGAAGRGAAPPRTAPQRYGGVPTSFPIVRSTLYLNLKQIS